LGYQQRQRSGVVSFLRGQDGFDALDQFRKYQFLVLRQRRAGICAGTRDGLVWGAFGVVRDSHVDADGVAVFDDAGSFSGQLLQVAGGDIVDAFTHLVCAAAETLFGISLAFKVRRVEIPLNAELQIDPPRT
jgi:hypothetical protein